MPGVGGVLYVFCVPLLLFSMFTLAFPFSWPQCSRSEGFHAFIFLPLSSMLYFRASCKTCCWISFCLQILSQIHHFSSPCLKNAFLKHGHVFSKIVFLKFLLEKTVQVFKQWQYERFLPPFITVPWWCHPFPLTHTSPWWCHHSIMMSRRVAIARQQCWPTTLFHIHKVLYRIQSDLLEVKLYQSSFSNMEWGLHCIVGNCLSGS